MALDQNRSGPAIADALMQASGIFDDLDDDGKDRFRDNVKVLMAEVNAELTGHLKVVVEIDPNVAPGTFANVAGPVLGLGVGPSSGTADPELGAGDVS